MDIYIVTAETGHVRTQINVHTVLEARCPSLILKAEASNPVHVCKSASGYYTFQGCLQITAIKYLGHRDQT